MRRRAVLLAVAATLFAGCANWNVNSRPARFLDGCAVASLWVLDKCLDGEDMDAAEERRRWEDQRDRAEFDVTFPQPRG